MRPDPSSWQDAKVYDSHGDRIGRVDGLFVDKESQQPEWLVVDTGLTGGEVLVPITGLEEVDEGVQLPFSEEQVKNSPSPGDVELLTADQERELYNYYGIPYSTDVSSTILGPRWQRGRGARACPVLVPGDSCCWAKGKPHQRFAVGGASTFRLSRDVLDNLAGSLDFQVFLPRHW